MRKLFWTMMLSAALLTMGACSDTADNSDAGDMDASDGAELEGCALVESLWEEYWAVEVEQSGLEGRTPQTNLMDVWGSSTDNIYAVGFKGAILHYDGVRWTAMDSGTDKDLEGVWGFVRRDGETGEITREEVFAAGADGIILRYDGNSWQTQAVVSDPDPNNSDPQAVTENLHDIWGTPASGDNPATSQPFVIAVGGNGIIVRFDSDSMQFIELRSPEQAERLQRDADGNVIYVDGVAQTEFYTVYRRFTNERLGGIFGQGGTFVAVGNNATILENNFSNDGDHWASPGGYSTAIFNDSLPHFAGAWGRNINDMFVVGLDGTYLIRNSSGYTLCEKLDDNPNAQRPCLEPPDYLRGFWGFRQERCGEIPDGGTQEDAPSSSWGFFIGWNGALHAVNSGSICALPGLSTNHRLEGIWGNAPRSREDRAIDGGIEDEMYECDPIEVVITGVDGTIIRLRNREGR